MNTTRILHNFNVEGVDFRNRVIVPVDGLNIRVNSHVTLLLPEGRKREAVVCMIENGYAELCVYS